MLYANYDAWIAGVKDWLDADHLTDAQIGTFIGLAQERLNLELSAWEMEETVTQTSDANGLITLPADFNRIRQVSISGVGTYETSSKGEIVNAGAVGDESRRLFAIDAGTIILYPAIGENVEVIVDYYVKVPPISASVDTNIFTENYSRLMLFAAMAEGSVFIVEDDRAQGFEQKYLIHLENSNTNPKRVKMGSTPLRRFVRTM